MEQLAMTNGEKSWLSKAKSFKLTDLLRPYIFPKRTLPNYRQLDAAKKSCFLRSSNDTASIWMTANIFGI